MRRRRPVAVAVARPPVALGCEPPVAVAVAGDRHFERLSRSMADERFAGWLEQAAQAI